MDLVQTVLPQVTKQIVDCKDVIAQQYLMECLIQVCNVVCIPQYHNALREWALKRDPTDKRESLLLVCTHEPNYAVFAK